MPLLLRRQINSDNKISIMNGINRNNSVERPLVRQIAQNQTIGQRAVFNWIILNDLT